jgi:hypothetical protein
MSDSDTDTRRISSSHKIPRFNGKRGEDYGLWRLRLRAACRAKNLWSLVDPAATRAPTTSTSDDVTANKERACSIIIAALGDSPLRVVADVDDDPDRMLALLDDRYASSRAASRIAVQTQLYRKTYNGGDMATFIDEFGTLFSQLERMGKDAAIPESHKAPMLLAAIPIDSSLEVTAAALRTKDVAELTWEFVATTLIDESEARSMRATKADTIGNVHNGRGRRSKTSFKHSYNNRTSFADKNDIDAAAKAFATAWRSKNNTDNDKSKSVCAYCDKAGHSIDKCFYNPDNPNHQLPPKVLHRLLVSTDTDGNRSRGAANSSKNRMVEIAGATVARTSVNVPKDLSSYIDSGATAHVFHNPRVFVPGSLSICEPRSIALADKSEVCATHVGEVVLPFENANIRLTGVYFVPDLGFNLVSVGRLADKGITATFNKSCVTLQVAESGFDIGSGTRDDNTGLYSLPAPEMRDTMLAVPIKGDSALWHQRLAHVNMRDLAQVHKHADGVPSLPQTNDVCRSCRLGKAHKLPFRSSFSRTTAPGELIHSDIVGPLPMSFPDKYQYMGTFLDDYSRHVVVALMQKKSSIGDAFAAFRRFLQQAASMRDDRVIDVEVDAASAMPCDMSADGFRIVRLHSDNAKEYERIAQDVANNDVVKTFSPPYTPEHNSIAERVNRTIMDPARSMLIHAGLPESLWPFAAKTVVAVRNRMPHSTTKATPFELLTGARPSLKNIRVFGCAAFVLRMPQSSKLQPRADEGTLLECGEHGIYKVLVCSDDAAPRIVESRHVTFDESSFPGANCLSNYMSDENHDDSDFASMSGESSDCESSAASECDEQVSVYSYQHDTNGPSSVEEVDPGMLDENVDHGADPADVASSPDDASEHEDADDDDEDFSPNEEGSAELQPEQAPAAATGRYPQRERRPPPAWMMAAYSPTIPTTFDVTTSDEPTLREAMKASPQEQALWLQAIEEEFDALDCKGTWVPDLKSHKQALPTHVILKVKRNADGSVERFKARIVAGGNHQQFGQDYFETYAPVVDFAIVRVFLYIAVCSNMRMVQVDVKTAFLNGELDEDVYVMSPRGVPGHPPSRRKLRKALYGLKQAHKAWHVKLVSDLYRLGFVELTSAPCVFMLKTDQGAVYILVYVDDLLVLAPTDELLSSVLTSLHRLYELRQMDDVTMFLGVKLSWTIASDGALSSVALSQPRYITDVLRRFGMSECKPAVTPMAEAFFTGYDAEEDKAVVHVELYRQIIGSLLYLALRTRPDVLVAVSILARFSQSPTAYCHRGAKRVLRYLRGTVNMALVYRNGETHLNAFVDSDYAGDTVDRKSMSGYFVKIGDAACIWGSKKQIAVALSTCEAEYHALTMAAKEVVWIRRVLEEAGVGISGATPVRSDNQSAIAWATAERIPLNRAKHIDVRVHFIRELVRCGVVSVEYVPTAINDADALTKPVGPTVLKEALPRIGLEMADDAEV